MAELSNPDGPEHTQVWFGPETRPLFGWVSRPAGGLARGGAILCPPMGEEGRAAHRTFRRLAEELAAAGIVALRFDYDGTGDSAGLPGRPRPGAELAGQHRGRPPVPPRPRRARASPRSACGSARPSRPARRPRRRRTPRSSAGTRACPGARSCARARRSTASGRPASTCPTTGCGTPPASSTTRTTAAELRGLDLGKLPADRPLADRVLLLTRLDRPVPPGIVNRLRAGGAAAGDRPRHRPGPAARRTARAQRRSRPTPCTRSWRWLAAAASRTSPRVPVKAPDAEHAVLVGSGPDESAPRARADHPAGPRAASSGWSTSRPTSRPSRAPGRPVPWVVLVNVAAEHHIGPGRRWVEWARRWAAHGLPRGPDRPERRRRQPDPARAAPMTGPSRRSGSTTCATSSPSWPRDGSRVGIVGLCSGSYSAFEVAMWEHVDAVFAINPRLTLYPAAKGTPGLHRPAPRGDAAQQAVRRASPSGTGSWPADCGGSTASSRSGTRRCWCCGGCCGAGPWSR